MLKCTILARATNSTHLLPPSLKGAKAGRVITGKKVKEILRMPVKTLLIGSAEVGKTSLLMRYSGLPFQEHVSSTVGIDFQDKELMW